MADPTVTVALVSAGSGLAVAVVGVFGAVTVKRLDRHAAPSGADGAIAGEVTASDMTVLYALQAVVRERDAFEQLADMWQQRALICEALRERDTRD